MDDPRPKSREERGLEIAARFRIVEKNGVWNVPSESGRGHYKVILDKPKGPDCTCPDFTKTSITCKHLWAVIHTVRGTDLSGVESGPVERTKPKKRKTYKQDWPTYNPAQMAEGHEFRFLLSGVCSTIEGRPRGIGRPLLSWSDIAYACTCKIYSMRSGRRASSEIWDAHVDDFLEKPVHYNTISSYLRNKNLSNVLRDLIFKSSLPLSRIEKVFAMDSTTFKGSRFVYEGQEGWNGQVERMWNKAHVLAGMGTHVIVDMMIPDNPKAGDAPQAPRLLERVAKGFSVEEILGDKGYDSAKIHRLIAEMGATAYIPFREGVSGLSGLDYEKAYHRYAMDQEKFWKHYHQRSNVESTFMSIKAILSEDIRSRTPISMRNEVYCKALAHNIRMLIYSMYELGIIAEFIPSVERAAAE
jgi:hypothetical protein